MSEMTPHDRIELFGLTETGTAVPIAADDTLATLASEITDLVVGGLCETGLAPVAAGIASDLVTALHRRIARMHRDADVQADRIRALAESQDGSEVADVELGEAMEAKTRLDESTDALEIIREAMAATLEARTGHTWTPRSGSRTGKTVTARMIEGREMEAAHKRDRACRLAPAGRRIAVAGGKHVLDVAHVYATLDRARARVPDMVLVTRGAPGCERIAQAWASTRGVDQIKVAVDWTKGKAAPFKAIDTILAMPLAGIVVIGGENEGIPQNLAQKGEAKRIRTWRVGAAASKPDGTEPGEKAKRETAD